MPFPKTQKWPMATFEFFSMPSSRVGAKPLFHLISIYWIL